MLITSVAMGMVGFGSYHTGYVEGGSETKIMYEDRIAFHETQQHQKFEFSENNLEIMLSRMNVKFPEVVKAQVKLETGHYSSKIYNENNNLFGMKKAYRRPSTCKGVRYGHCYYDDWIDSVIDYVIYQRVFLSNVYTSDDYLKILGMSYAEDPKYANKLVSIMKEVKLN